MTLPINVVSEGIDSFLRGVPKAPRAVTVPDDPCVERYFDLDKYYRKDSDDNQSRSGSSSAHTPGLVTDTASIASAPSDPGSDDLPAESRSQDSRRETLKEFRKTDPPIVWPQADPNQHVPRADIIQVSTSKGKSGQNGSPASTRQVKDPAQTAQVRKLGACMKCRIEKLRCSDGGVCDSCSRYPEHLRQRACLRKTLTDTAKQSAPRRYTGLKNGEDQAVANPKGTAIGELEVCMQFPPPGSAVLLTVFQVLRPAGEGPREAIFRRSSVPRYNELVAWAERQIEMESEAKRNVDFAGAIEMFIMRYTQAGNSLPRANLMHKIHQMKCMYRIWKADDTLLFSRGADEPGEPLPRFVKVELRRIVRQALESTERDIFNELDKFLKPAGISSEDRAALWAGLWQLIFIFKDLNGMLGDSQPQRPQCDNLPKMHGNFEERKTATEQLFVALLAFYGSHYRTATCLRVKLPPQLGRKFNISNVDDQRIGESFQRAYLARGQFHDSIRASSNELDRLIKELVVNHEIKRLSNPRTKRTDVVVTTAIPARDVDRDGDVTMTE